MILDDAHVTTQEVKDWKGLHLLHFQGSSCSQKVRTLLREKQLAYVSHPVNLMRHEHATPWYLGINPRGVVPVLVHDGVVHIESNDIMAYLDSLPSPVAPFFPQDETERAQVQASLDLEDSLHTALREITMGFMVPKRFAQKPDEVLDMYESEGAEDPSRAKEVAWWRAFAAQGITEPQARAAVLAYRQAFDTLEAKLEGRDWLMGDRVSVMEITWFISINRLVLAGYPLGLHPNLSALYRKLSVRPAFAEETRSPALLQYVVLPLYQAVRGLKGTRLVNVAAAELR